MVKQKQTTGTSSGSAAVAVVDDSDNDSVIDIVKQKPGGESSGSPAIYIGGTDYGQV